MQSAAISRGELGRLSDLKGGSGGPLLNWKSLRTKDIRIR